VWDIFKKWAFKELKKIVKGHQKERGANLEETYLITRFEKIC